MESPSSRATKLAQHREYPGSGMCENWNGRISGAAHYYLASFACMESPGRRATKLAQNNQCPGSGMCENWNGRIAVTAHYLRKLRMDGEPQQQGPGATTAQ